MLKDSSTGYVMLRSELDLKAKFKLKLPRSIITTPVYAMQHGACWVPFASAANDLPCGFTDLGSLLTFFLVGTPAFNFDAVYAMSWVSKASAILAYAPAYPKWLSPTGVLYTSVGYAPHAWYSLQQIGAPDTPSVQPMVSSAVCKEYGLTWVAISLDTPAKPTDGDGAGCTWFSCEFGWRTPVSGTLTEL
jgi:hypothetical protein